MKTQLEKAIQLRKDDKGDEAIKEFVDDRSLKIFRALTLYNLVKSEESIEQLLILLLETTGDQSIKAYDKALRFYSDKLSEAWK